MTAQVDYHLTRGIRTLMSLYLIPESRELKDSRPPCTLYSVVNVKSAAARGKR
jgi:hypothetical protein